MAVERGCLFLFGKRIKITLFPIASENWVLRSRRDSDSFVLDASFVFYQDLSIHVAQSIVPSANTGRSCCTSCCSSSLSYAIFHEKETLIENSISRFRTTPAHCTFHFLPSCWCCRPELFESVCLCVCQAQIIPSNHTNHITSGQQKGETGTKGASQKRAIIGLSCSYWKINSII